MSNRGVSGRCFTDTLDDFFPIGTFAIELGSFFVFAGYSKICK